MVILSQRKSGRIANPLPVVRSIWASDRQRVLCHVAGIPARRFLYRPGAERKTRLSSIEQNATQQRTACPGGLLPTATFGAGAGYLRPGGNPLPPRPASWRNRMQPQQPRGRCLLHHGALRLPGLPRGRSLNSPEDQRGNARTPIQAPASPILVRSSPTNSLFLAGNRAH